MTEDEQCKVTTNKQEPMNIEEKVVNRKNQRAGKSNEQLTKRTRTTRRQRVSPTRSFICNKNFGLKFTFWGPIA